MLLQDKGPLQNFFNYKIVIYVSLVTDNMHFFVGFFNKIMLKNTPEIPVYKYP